MHELSIAQSILDTVLEERRTRGLDRIDSITVRVGALSGVLPDALQFSFEAIRIDTLPIRVSCRQCNTETAVENFLFVCPVCDSVHVDVVSGYELEVTSIVVPDRVTEPVDP